MTELIKNQIQNLAKAGLTPQEISSRLQIPLEWLRSQFHEALQKGYETSFMPSEPRPKAPEKRTHPDRKEYDRQRAKDFYRQQKEKASEGDPVALERIAKAKAYRKAWRQKNKDRVNLYNRKYLALLQERAENGDKEAIELLDRRKASMQKAHKKQRRNPKNDIQPEDNTKAI